MERHFVESYLGGYYFSCSDVEIIEEYCDTCGDSDMVLFTYDDEDKEEPAKSLIDYFCCNYIKTGEDLERMLIAYDAEHIGISEAVSNIKTGLLFDLDGAKEILSCLLDDNEITQEEFKKIETAIDIGFVNQMAFINRFDYKSIDLSRAKTRKRNKSGE